jgi:hypothetical protein
MCEPPVAPLTSATCLTGPVSNEVFEDWVGALPEQVRHLHEYRGVTEVLDCPVRSYAGGPCREKGVWSVRVRRTFVAPMMTMLLISMGSPAVAATPPVGTCPPSFDGPLTFRQIVKKYPPPPELPDPIGALASFDKNGDGSLCVLDIPHEPINVIDNVASVPS